jgi:hypothetical protein
MSVDELATSITDKRTDFSPSVNQLDDKLAYLDGKGIVYCKSDPALGACRTNKTRNSER